MVLLFPFRFWGPLDTFGSIADDPAERGRYYLFYQYDGISGASVLAALVAGKAAVTQESMAAADCVQGVMRVLRTMFGGKGRPPVPAPLKVQLFVYVCGFLVCFVCLTLFFSISSFLLRALSAATLFVLVHNHTRAIVP